MSGVAQPRGYDRSKSDSRESTGSIGVIGRDVGSEGRGSLSAT